MADEFIDLTYTFAGWDEVDTGDGIAFKVVLACEAVGVRSEGAVVARMALLEDRDHTKAYALGKRAPELAYLRFAGPEQAASLGASLIRAAQQFQREN